MVGEGMLLVGVLVEGGRLGGMVVDGLDGCLGCMVDVFGLVVFGLVLVLKRLSWLVMVLFLNFELSWW